MILIGRSWPVEIAARARPGCPGSSAGSRSATSAGCPGRHLPGPRDRLGLGPLGPRPGELALRRLGFAAGESDGQRLHLGPEVDPQFLRTVQLALEVLDLQLEEMESLFDLASRH